MSKTSEIREIIRQVLSDGAEHSVEDVWAECVRQEVISSKERSIVRGALYYMKQRGEVRALSSGIYRMCSEEETPEPEAVQIGALTLEELKAFSCRMEQTCRELKQFNWILCSDAELEQAREKVLLLRRIREQIRTLDVTGGR